MSPIYACPADIIADAALTEDEKIDLVAAWILNTYHAAFEELAR